MSFSISCPAYVVAALYPAISTEADRYYLRGIFFESPYSAPTENGFAVAADGHIMTVARDRIRINDPGIYPISEAAYNKAKSAKAETVRIAEGVLYVFDEDENTLHMEPCKPIDGTFPDWRRAIPTGSLVATGAGFDAQIIDLLTATARAATKVKNAQITFQGEDSLSPHLVLYGVCKTVFSVVMPTHINGDESEIPFSI